MLNMSESTRMFLKESCAGIPWDLEHLNDILDLLDEMELDSLDENYNPTERTRPIIYAIDDLYVNNN